MNLRTIKRLALGALLVGSAVLATSVQTGGLHGPLSVSASAEDSLYVAEPDPVLNSVQRFDAQTGQYLGAFVPSGSGGLEGPRGLLFAGKEGNLLVMSANNDLTIPSMINEYDHKSGTFEGALVPSSAPQAPSNGAGRGIILGQDHHVLYVADLGAQNIGAVKEFDVQSGKFLGQLDFDSFIESAANTTGEFHPKALVFGPDGLLYLSLFSEITFPGPEGWILSYNLKTGAVKLVSMWNPKASDCSSDLHRPEGLVFGPDGKLYVASFRANANDFDRILVYTINPDGTGTCTDEIPLYQVGQPRAYAQDILFGPGGYLYVPISGNGPDTGAVRKYDVSTKTYTNFVAPGGPLQSGWYLTFGKTNPHTLAYGQ